MKKETHKNILQDPSLKENPFKVPEGYFDDMAERLMQEREGLVREEKPVRRMNGSRRFKDLVRHRRIALAAALAGLALLSYPLIRVLGPSSEIHSLEELALLEESGLYYNDYMLAVQMGEDALDDDQAFASLAENYLAGSSGAMNLYLEIE